jgi:hypothetical protein
MKPDVLYYLASPEAVALIEAFYGQRDVYRKATHVLRDSVGATDVIVRDRSKVLVALEFKNVPVPAGWKRMPKKWRCPPDSFIGPTGWDSGLPPLPSAYALDAALGIGPSDSKIYTNDGKVYEAVTEYGHEKVGDSWVIQQRSLDGVPHGNPPTGCKPLKKSEYFALKGE